MMTDTTSGQAARIEIQHHFDPTHPELVQHISIRFTCPHLRMGQPAISAGSETFWIHRFLDLHDYRDPPECTSELRQRFLKDQP